MKVCSCSSMIGNAERAREMIPEFSEVSRRAFLQQEKVAGTAVTLTVNCRKEWSWLCYTGPRIPHLNVSDPTLWLILAKDSQPEEAGPTFENISFDELNKNSHVSANLVQTSKKLISINEFKFMEMEGHILKDFSEERVSWWYWLPQGGNLRGLLDKLLVGHCVLDTASFSLFMFITKCSSAEGGCFVWDASVLLRCVH